MTLSAFCPDCGAEITAESRHCASCGRDLLAVGSHEPVPRLGGDPPAPVASPGPSAKALTSVRVAGWLWLVVAGLQTIVSGSSVLSAGLRETADWLGAGFAVVLILVALAVGRGLAFRPTRSVAVSALLLGVLWLALGVLSLLLGLPAGIAIAALAVLAALLSLPALRVPSG
jgi:hypothetical protein